MGIRTAHVIKLMGKKNPVNPSVPILVEQRKHTLKNLDIRLSEILNVGYYRNVPEPENLMEIFGKQDGYRTARLTVFIQETLLPPEKAVRLQKITTKLLKQSDAEDELKYRMADGSADAVYSLGISGFNEIDARYLKPEGYDGIVYPNGKGITLSMLRRDGDNLDYKATIRLYEDGNIIVTSHYYSGLRLLHHAVKIMLEEIS